MSSLTYSIKKLACQYPKSAYPVLYIEELDIPKSKMIFLVGASGVGKSTVLETLGIMNDTIVAEAGTLFRFYGQNTGQADEGIDLSSIWKQSERALARFRREHLSFIFQDMNLFFHLSMYQNACLPSILQGEREEDAIKSSNVLFRNILPDVITDQPEDRPVVRMSGGQRQRLAFIRALSTTYSVLFADEPTGNLDAVNARKLMDILATNDHAKSSTRVIVSHDINLALDYADEIVLIAKQKTDTAPVEIGWIDSSSKFIRQEGGWTNGSIELERQQLFDKLIMALANETA